MILIINTIKNSVNNLLNLRSFIIFSSVFLCLFIQLCHCVNHELSNNHLIPNVTTFFKSDLNSLVSLRIYYLSDKNKSFSERFSFTQKIFLQKNNWNEININFVNIRKDVNEIHGIRIDIDNYKGTIYSRNWKFNNKIQITSNNTSHNIKIEKVDNEITSLYIDGDDPYFYLWEGNVKANTIFFLNIVTKIAIAILLFTFLIYMFKYIELTLTVIIFIIFEICYIYCFALWDTSKEYLLIDVNYSSLSAIYKIVYSQIPVILSIVLLLSFSSILKKENWQLLLKYICQTLVLLILTLLSIDVFSYTSFKTHVSIDDIFSFSNDINKSIPIIKTFIVDNKTIAVGFISIFIIFLASSFTYDKNIKNKLLTLSFFNFLILIMLFLAPYPMQTIFDNHFANIYTSSAQNINKNKNYSIKYKYTSDELSTIEVHGLNKRKNVIVLFVESLSEDERKLLDGVNDDMPNIDNLSQQYSYFLNYLSNGYNTDTGNFAFLTSLPYIHSEISMTDPKFYKLAVPKQFKENGYLTNYVYSAENIGQLEDIVRNSGFQNLYDGKAPFYKDEERLIFNSVPDKALLNRVLNLLPSWGENKPYFTLVQTTTSHNPYIVPGTIEENFNKTIRYVDKAVYNFYQELVKRKFFENGMLIITGDHRAMVPYYKNQIIKFKRRGIARVPLIIIDNDFKNKVFTELSSHNSLGAILEYLNLKKFIKYKQNKIPIIDLDNARQSLVFYQYHSPSDKVLVVNEAKNDEHTISENIITLNGDETRFENELNGDYSKEEIFKELYWLRTKK